MGSLWLDVVYVNFSLCASFHISICVCHVPHISNHYPHIWWNIFLGLRILIMHVTFTREKSATTPWVKHYLEDELDASSMTLPTILITHHPLCAEVWNFWRRVVFCLLFFVCNHLFFAICSSMHLDLMIARNILRGVKHFQKSSLEGWKSFCRKVYLRTRGGTHLHLTCHFTKSECSRRAWTTLNNGIPPLIESDSLFVFLE